MQWRSMHPCYNVHQSSSSTKGFAVVVNLAYGRLGLTVDLPADRTDVVEPLDTPGLADEAQAIAHCLDAPIGTLPLRNLAVPGDRVVIVVNDGTRPMPSARVLPAILRRLSHLPCQDITILVATGTHRANTTGELELMLGRDVVQNYTVVNHDARDNASLSTVGTTHRGHPILINRLFVDADVTVIPALWSRISSPAFRVVQSR